MIMEAEKSYNLSSACWRPRKAGGVILKPENQRADGADSSPGLKV